MTLYYSFLFSLLLLPLHSYRLYPCLGVALDGVWIERPDPASPSDCSEGGRILIRGSNPRSLQLLGEWCGVGGGVRVSAFLTRLSGPVNFFPPAHVSYSLSLSCSLAFWLTDYYIQYHHFCPIPSASLSFHFDVINSLMESCIENWCFILLIKICICVSFVHFKGCLSYSALFV